MKSKRKRRQLNRWRVAIHEAAHWVFAEWFCTTHVDVVTIKPSDDYAGQMRPTHPPSLYSKEQVRHRLLGIVAGRAAENAITGTRRYVDGTDFHQAFDLGDAQEVLSAFTEAESLCRGIFWEPIMTAATELWQHETIRREQAGDLWQYIAPADKTWYWVNRGAR